jgi:N-acetylmuramoyl-L-alanine amidase
LTPVITKNPLPYVHRLQPRDRAGIELAVIHCTELPDLEMARTWGEKVVHSGSRTGNSGHFYIDRDGSIEQWVPVERTAHHVRGLNACSIGFELVNRGRYPNWLHSASQQMTEPYPEAQIEALAALLNALCKRLGALARVAGHADLDTGLVSATDRPEVRVRRKLDPGPLFPWQTLLGKVPLERLAVPARDGKSR